ncbi:MAG TPA: hypothetical protein VNV36_19265 [Pseudomonas sp.]|uniref:hypothetical protein n=1 Tax=Pseudomonas sp. TaxID=306 RepID=UPI002BBC5DDF|nr:hypothetical protein [Pseudomonas sp.]HWH88894.1 hypothetical protein [Pseudomonas sp.]
MTKSNATRRSIGILASPLSVEGIDDSDLDGHVPLDILLNGSRIIIPYWDDPNPKDELWIELAQDGSVTRLYTEYLDPPQPAYLYFPLTPAHLVTDGVAFLSYKVWKASGGIPDPSPDRKLTIDHTPMVVLDTPEFPNATRWGYLNNNTHPPLTCGVTVSIPTANGFAAIGDRAKLYWQGYSSLNASGPPVPESYGDWDILLEQKHIDKHWEFVVPFEPCIRPLVDYDSAVARWQLFKGGRLYGESKNGSVMIDRVTPGEPGPFGLSIQGEMEMTFKLLPPKQRPASFGVKEVGLFSAITAETLTDNYIAKSVMDSGILIVNLDRTSDEDDNDDVDVELRVKGGIFETIGTVPLGPIADRPAGKIPLEIDTSKIQELPTPIDPTTYEIRVKVYKGGGGIEDPSNIIEVVVDQTAPFHTKNPRREARPTPAPTFVNRPTDPQVTVTEAWMALPANANVNCKVPVNYPQRRPADDKVRVWLRNADLSVLVFEGTVPDTGEISFSNSELRKFPPRGRVNIVQQYEDLPGNPSLESAPIAFLTLALAQVPVSNKGPLVPRTDPNFTTPLYLDDLASGISAIVESAFIDNAETGDQIYITIEDANDATVFHDFDPQAWTGANLTFPLEYENLAKIFADATEPKRVNIKYTITRTGMTTDVESPIETFILAFDYAGPENPDLPDLTNSILQLPVVTGASKTPNSLLPGDRSKSATFKVVFALTDPPLTPEQTATCYINGVRLEPYVPFVDETEFEVEIPTSVVTGLPTPSVKAFWTIQKSGVDKNIMRSKEETVLVAGHPIPLPTPTVRIRKPDTRPYIECFAMKSPTSSYDLGLIIPKDPLLPPGKTIKVHFEAHKTAAGDDLIPNTKVSADYTIAAADVQDFAPTGTTPAVFKAAQPARGAVAYGKYWYTTDINGEQSSTPVVRRIDTISTSFTYCDGTAAPAPAP